MYVNVQPTRKLPRSPYKVLDAPDLREDFYLNLLDWGSSNVLAVGLGPCVYLWMSATAEVIKLTDVTKPVPIAGGPGTTQRMNMQDVSAIKWNESGSQLAVGLVSGHVQIWDVEAQRCVNELKPHAARVGVLAWRAACLQSGSRDHHVWHRDTRCASGSSQPDIRLVAHKQEVYYTNESHKRIEFILYSYSYSTRSVLFHLLCPVFSCSDQFSPVYSVRIDSQNNTAFIYALLTCDL